MCNDFDYKIKKIELGDNQNSKFFIEMTSNLLFNCMNKF